MTDWLRSLLAAAMLLVLLPAGAAAHHGWRWAEQENSRLQGTILETRLGNPHGIVTVETAEGEVWQVEIGQPWRNQAAGLSDDRLRPGVMMQVQGHRSADPEERLMKAERVSIGGTTYTLYPDRD